MSKNKKKLLAWSVVLLIAVLLGVFVFEFGFTGKTIFDVQGTGNTYYVDYSRTANGNGSLQSPWKDWSNIDWTSVSNNLNSGNVTIYLSSRAVFGADNVEYFNIGASGNSNYWLILDGNSRYNSASSGSAQWSDEYVSSNKATFSSLGGNGGSLYIFNNQNNIYIKGIRLEKPAWGGVNIGSANPTQNISFIVVDNVFVNSPINNQGIWFGYAEDGCHDIVIKNSIVNNTQLEGIYVGHYNYLKDTITGVIIENNTLIDTGLSGEGDIDIKPGVYGAIVRYNKNYRTGNYPHTGSVSGVVVAADNVSIYGNEFFFDNYKSNGDGDWGYGIYANADGADGTGKSINSIFIYNNLIYGNDRSGIRLLASRAFLTGAKIYNNVVWDNGHYNGSEGYGIELRGSSPYNVTVDDMKNNIVGNNYNYDVAVTGNSFIKSADYNIYYRSSGNSWYYGAEKTFAQWKALGFDSHGINVNPLFTSYSYGSFNNNFHLLSNSPAINVGTDLSSIFTTDKESVLRPQGSAWDIGAYEYVSGTPLNPADINGDRIISSFESLNYTLYYKRQLTWPVAPNPIDASNWLFQRLLFKRGGNYTIIGSGCPPSGPNACWTIA